MNVSLSSFYEMHESTLAVDAENPLFRKATSNMIAAYTVCEKALRALTPDQKKSVSLIVSTQFGEVSSTLEFLTTFYDSKIAKPILFQNSLHNSTLGFVSIQLNLTGPALTLSADERINEALAETAAGLLSLTDHVLVCQVDMVPDFVKENYAVAYPHLKDHLGWARAFLISKSSALLPARSVPKDLFEFKYTQEFTQLRSLADV
ncbi:MAG: beta-ketoacyl synthase chain length factor [Bdellovibrionaceae bacterium]|nr:beta-ketoacyl synthase chain length factor [Bdellovibrio sp.]